MNTLKGFPVFALFALLSALATAEAKERAPEFGFEAGAGYQYDSNVSLAEIDQNTGEADSALLLNAGVNASLPIAGKLAFNIGYDYAQTSYRQFSQFDLALHHGNAELALGVAGFDTSVTLDRFDARLDHGKFLDITQVSPAVGRLFGERFYLRGAYVHADKSYAESETRNALNEAIRADAYLLIDGMKRYLSFGYRVDAEDAIDDELDFDGNRAMLAYGHRIELGRVDLGVKATLQYENRDYLHVTESIGERRRDQRLRASLNTTVQLTEYFAITGSADYADNRSNLASAAFDEMVYTLGLNLEF